MAAVLPARTGAKAAAENVSDCAVILTTYRPVKLKGFRALYFKYLYLLRNARGAAPHRTKTPVSKAEVIKFERYTRQFQFLHKNRIDTDAELAMLTEALEVADRGAD